MLQKTPFGQAIETTNERISASLLAEDWRRVDGLLERLAGLLIDATIAGSAADIARAEELYAEIHDALVLGRAVQIKPSDVGTAWQTKAYGAVAVQARVRRPLPTREQAEAATQSAREKILEALRSSNSGALSNKELAARTGMHAGTIARVLPVLRGEGLVRSWQAGQTMQNRITAAGRSALSGSTPSARNEVSRSLPLTRQHYEGIDKSAAPRVPFARIEKKIAIQAEKVSRPPFIPKKPAADVPVSFELGTIEASTEIEDWHFKPDDHSGVERNTSDNRITLSRVELLREPECGVI